MCSWLPTLSFYYKRKFLLIHRKSSLKFLDACSNVKAWKNKTKQGLFSGLTSLSIPDLGQEWILWQFINEFLKWYHVGRVPPLKSKQGMNSVYNSEHWAVFFQKCQNISNNLTTSSNTSFLSLYQNKICCFPHPLCLFSHLNPTHHPNLSSLCFCCSLFSQ